MINLSYKFDQNSSSLELAGMPDVSNGDSEDIIGIISSWKLKIIGYPLLEGEKEHLDYLMYVISHYSRSYISGFRKTFISKNNIITLKPFGYNHKLLLNSTKENVKPLEIILDDSELSDLTRCLDLLKFDHRFNIKWNTKSDLPFSKRYILSNFYKPKKYHDLIYAIVIFFSTSLLLVLIPINDKFEFKDNNITRDLTEEINN